MPKKGGRQKSSLMGIDYSKSSKKLDMSQTLPSPDLDGVAEYIKTKKPKNVVFCVGAGISTNAGIPDFRTPGTGLYSNLAALNLPYPEAVFSMQYFRQDPQPFYTLAQSLYPGAFKPTLTHTFIRLLQEKSMLLKCFTQNIDTLERVAGVAPSFIVEAHGSFASSKCIDCGLEYPNEKMKETLDLKEIPRCPKCDGLVKPNIVFFGEALPESFWTSRYDMHNADLVFVIGTSLIVQPFALLPGYALPKAPRILLNNDPVETFDRPNDAFIQGDCDESIWKLCQKLGWDDELRELHKKIDGVSREWDMGFRKESDESKEESDKTVVEDAVAKLTKELEEELKLDKEEDAEVQKVGEQADKSEKSDKSDEEEHKSDTEVKGKI